jgi:Transposase DDE domain
MPQSEHDSVPALDEQLRRLIEADWQQEVLSQLPPGYQQQARQSKAFVRARKLGSVADLLRGLLAYVLCVRSLRQLGVWANLIGLADLSHVAWQKHLRRAAPFLLWLLAQLLAVAPVAAPKPASRIVLVDGTRLKEPGGCGDDWRLHLAYDLLAGRLLQVKVSDRHTAEALSLFDWQSGDLLVADRGYCRRSQLVVVLQAGAQFVVRLAVHQVPLLDENGQPFDVLAWLKAPGEGQHSCQVSFEHEGQRFACRLIASALPAEAAERARAKERKKASKQQRELKEETLYLCGWLLLLSTCSSKDWSDEQLLALYRARWQIELAIKALKQLLPLVQLRGQTTQTNEATLLALLVATALQQNVASQLRQQLSQALTEWSQQHQPAPWANEANEANKANAANEATISSWTLRALSVQTLRQVVQGYWNIERLYACLPHLGRYVCHRRKRPHQESTIRSQVLARLTAAPPETSFLLFKCLS